MSDAEEIKAGHPPAAKVGNMRVTGNRSRNSSSSAATDKPISAEEKKKQEEEFNSGEANEAPPQGQVVAGAVVADTQAFTPAAVKAYHEKPMPTHEKPHPNVSHQHHIHQPRK